MKLELYFFFLTKETSLVSKVLIFNPILNKYLLNTDYTLRTDESEKNFKAWPLYLGAHWRRKPTCEQ